MVAATGDSASTTTWSLQEEAPLRPRKQWGQHFLVSRSILQRIIDAAEVSPNDDLIEVGPGRGILTRELARHARRVLAIEVDAALVARLRTELATYQNLKVVHGDILDYPPERLLSLFPSTEENPAPPESYLVVANLPYNIAAPTLRLFLDSPRPPKRLVVMVQYEVAKNIVASPGEMRLLSVAVQYYGRPKLVAKVLPQSFSPAPKVTSAILRIDPYPAPPVAVPSTVAFFETVRAGFAAPRKQLRNALAQGLGVPTDEAAQLLAHSGIDPQRRAQTLSLEEWARLAWARFESAPAA